MYPTGMNGTSSESYQSESKAKQYQEAYQYESITPCYCNQPPLIDLQHGITLAQTVNYVRSADELQDSIQASPRETPLSSCESV